MNGKAVVVDLFYLPPLEYFVAIQDFDTLLIEAQDNFQKQTYRNRARVQLANKVGTLSIPLVGSNKKVKYREVKIDDSQAWRKVHLRGIKSAYGKAPFFEYFFPELEKIYLQNISRLYEHNFQLLTICLKFMQLPVKMNETHVYGKYKEETDLRGLIKTKEPFDCRNIYEPYPYAQLFGLNFVPNLSIIDLLFCEGPNSKNILNCSKKETEHSWKGLRF